MTKKGVLIALFLIGLIYMLAPGPNRIDDFSAIPDSLKSNEPGDTYQVPHIAAYFSNLARAEITMFYREDFRKQFIFGWLFPPVSLNYPPIAAYQYVRDMLQNSTFLEEYVYPFRGSIFVAGYDPYVEAEIRGVAPDKFGEFIYINGEYFKSKTTIRYYPAPWYINLLIYLAVCLCTVATFKLIKKVNKI